MKRKVLSALERIVEGRMDYDVPMSKLTSIRIGGPAWAVVHPGDERELMEAMSFCRDHDVPFVIIGNGTNLLVLDGGIEAVVIRVGRGLDHIRIIKHESGHMELYAGAGLHIRRLLGFAAAHGLSGIDFLAGVPGTIGGAVATNAGAAGHSVAERITHVCLVNTRREQWKVAVKDLRFTYRTMQLPPESAVSGSFFRLFSREASEVRRTMGEFMKNRMRTQPLRYPSAGCMFKNPTGDYAGRLIDAAGMKGRRCGDAQISEVHANFIINRGHARAADVIYLMEKARERVKLEAGIDLDPEIRTLGTSG
ncbi:MAG: UDP-N-acetylmuramate dehydrogenase [Deltaproteobacteria bacterium]|nr:UDP-N-acetylmuramate dehydrogenase [Deltaproteobacteria bacterium]